MLHGRREVLQRAFLWHNDKLHVCRDDDELMAIAVIGDYIIRINNQTATEYRIDSFEEMWCVGEIFCSPLMYGGDEDEQEYDDYVAEWITPRDDKCEICGMFPDQHERVHFNHRNHYLNFAWCCPGIARIEVHNRACDKYTEPSDYDDFCGNGTELTHINVSVNKA